VSTVRGARRRNHDSHRFARVIRRGLSFHAAFRYPFWRTRHNWAGPTSLSIRQRSWDFCTLRSIPRLRVPAFASPAIHDQSLNGSSRWLKSSWPRLFFRRSSPLAVCRSFNTAAFYGCWPPCLNSFQASRARYGQLPNDRTGFWVLCRRQAKPTASGDAPGQSCHGFHCLLSGLQMCPRTSWINQRLPNHVYHRHGRAEVFRRPACRASKPHIAETAPGFIALDDFHPLMGFVTTGKECARAKCRE